jgi:hypothetical protein
MVGLFVNIRQAFTGKELRKATRILIRNLRSQRGDFNLEHAEKEASYLLDSGVLLTWFVNIFNVILICNSS